MTTLTITAGNHFTFKMVYKDESGYAINLDGATAKFVMRRSMYAPVLINRSAVIIGGTGEINVALIPTDTVGLLDDVLEEQFVFGVSLTQLNGTKTIIVSGEVTLKQNIARD